MMGGDEVLFTSTDIFHFPNQEAVEKLSENGASFLGTGEAEPTGSTQSSQNVCVVNWTCLGETGAQWTKAEFIKYTGLFIHITSEGKEKTWRLSCKYRKSNVQEHQMQAVCSGKREGVGPQPFLCLSGTEQKI